LKQCGENRRNSNNNLLGWNTQVKRRFPGAAK